MGVDLNLFGVSFCDSVFFVDGTASKTGNVILLGSILMPFVFPLANLLMKVDLVSVP